MIIWCQLLPTITRLSWIKVRSKDQKVKETS